MDDGEKKTEAQGVNLFYHEQMSAIIKEKERTGEISVRDGSEFTLK